MSRRGLAELFARVRAVLAAQAAHDASLCQGLGGLSSLGGARPHVSYVQCRGYAQLPPEYQALYPGKAAVPKPRPAAAMQVAESATTAAESSTAAAAEAKQPSRPLTPEEQKASAQAGQPDSSPCMFVPHVSTDMYSTFMIKIHFLLHFSTGQLSNTQLSSLLCLYIPDLTILAFYLTRKQVGCLCQRGKECGGRQVSQKPCFACGPPFLFISKLSGLCFTCSL